MKQQLVTAFDTVHMSPACSDRIEKAMLTKGRRQPVAFRRAIVTACLILAMFILMNPGTVQAVEEIIEKAKSIFIKGPNTIHMEEDYIYYNDGNTELEVFHHPNDSIVTVSGLCPPWLKVMDGKVYFTGTAEKSDLRYFLDNKEKFDITGQFSEEEPFTCIFDTGGITHYIAIAGDFDPAVGLDSIKYLEHLRLTDEIENGRYAGWLTGSGSWKYQDVEGTKLAVWYAKAVVQLELHYDYDYEEAVKLLEELEAEKSES